MTESQQHPHEEPPNPDDGGLRYFLGEWFPNVGIDDARATFIFRDSRGRRTCEHVPLTDLGEEEVDNRLLQKARPAEAAYAGMAIRSLSAIKERAAREGKDWRFLSGKQEEVKALTGLWIDLDAKEGRHSKANLPTLEELEAIISEVGRRSGGLLSPTMIIHSGGGLYPLVLFKGPVLIGDDIGTGQRLSYENARRLVKAYQQCYSEVMVEMRFDPPDPTADLSRQLRLPGSFNRKKDPVVQAKVVFRDGPRQELADILGLLCPEVNTDAHKPKTEQAQNICEGCAQIRHAYDHAAKLPEPPWYAAVGVIAHTPDGVNEAHHMSRPHPGYSYEETEAKARRALQVGPTTCAHFQSLDASLCEGCHFFERRNGSSNPRVSPITLATPLNNSRETQSRLSLKEFTSIPAPELESRLWETIDDATRWSDADWAKAQFHVEPYLPQRIAARWIKAINAARKTSRSKLTIESIANALLEQTPYARDPSGQLYAYADGVYVPAEAKLKADMKRYLVERGAGAQWRKRLQDEVAEFIRADAPLLQDALPIGRINLLNGVYDVREGRSFDHTPGLLSSVQFNVSYDPNADCPNIKEFLQAVLPADCQDFLADLLALIMMSDNPADQCFMLRGSGGNGKSVFLEILIILLGRSNISSMELHDLAENRFASANLYGKVANISADISSADLGRTGRFKALTSGDPIMAERKHRDAFQFVPRAILIFSANKTPQSEDQSSGFFRRWVIVPFMNQFTGKKRVKKTTLLDKLTTDTELSGLLNWALKRWPIVAKNGVPSPPSMQEAHRQFQMESNPFGTWLQEMTVPDSDGYIACGDLYDSYRQFAKESGYPVQSNKAVGIMLRQYSQVERRRLSTLTEKNERPYVYFGIRWASEVEEPTIPSDPVHDGLDIPTSTQGELLYPVW